VTRNYYTVLQVSPSAEQEVVEAAYKRLARKYHPDVYSGADGPNRMRELNEAYEVLGDRRRRAEYDATLGRARARAGASASGQERPASPPGAPAVPKGPKKRKREGGPARPGTRPGRSRRSIGRFRNLGFVAALAAAVIAAIVLIGVANLFRGDDGNTGNNPIVIPPHTAPADGMTLGNDDAPITIYVYSDFQCPFCQRAAAEVVPQLDTEYLATGKAKLIFKNFAFLDDGFEGQESKNAAEASACASEQGKFWEYHNKLYENQEGENKGAFKVENLKRFAGEIGLNQVDFDTCFDERKYAAQIADERDEAENRGVNSSPTFFVNQTEITPASFGELYGDLVDAIEAVLNPPTAAPTAEGTAPAEATPGG
jgi:protein-disulfide isomerase